MAAETQPPAPIVVDRYELLDEIASGGMATVHLGRLRGSAGFARAVAIKRLHGAFSKDPEFAAMLIDEARVTTRVRHPNVVPTLDVVANAGELFLVMDFVLGDSLAALLRAVKRAGDKLAPSIIAAILVDVLGGLHAAHEALGEDGEALQIVHRDVSPQNILVGADGLARVLDFGVAKAVGRLHTTRDGSVKGKLAYMAPEQITLDAIDHRADVFAASIVLWEALVGERLFARDNAGRTLDAVMRDEVKAPSALAGSPAALNEVVLRGLDRDPERRYPTAIAMAEAIERAVVVAPRRDVGAAMKTFLGETIGRRRALLQSIESRSREERAPEIARSKAEAASSNDATQPALALSAESTAVEPVETGTAAPIVRRRSRARIAVAAVLSLSAIVIAAATRAALFATPSSAASSPAALLASSAPPFSATAVATTIPPVVAEASASVATTASAVASARRPPPPSRPACADPFRRDEHGILVPRPECFR